MAGISIADRSNSNLTTLTSGSGTILGNSMTSRFPSKVQETAAPPSSKVADLIRADGAGISTRRVFAPKT
jgi:hypothetical protein